MMFYLIFACTVQNCGRVAKSHYERHRAACSNARPILRCSDYAEGLFGRIALR
jgi:hypothetical protein